MLELKNVSVTYDPHTIFTTHALINVSLTIHKNEAIGIVGRIGSGKSTLVQLFNGLIKPDKGTVLLDGIDINGRVTDLQKVRKKVGLVFQYPEEQFFAENVFDEVAFGPKNMGIKGNELKKNVYSALSDMGFSPEQIEKRSPFSLSGGEKRRVAIASIIAMNPEILVLDEPTAGMDFRGKERLLNYIRNEMKHGRTIVFVTHNMDELLEVADRVIALKNGEKIFDGAIEAFFSEEGVAAATGVDIPTVARLYSMLRKRFPDFPFSRTPLELAMHIKERFEH